MESTDEQELDLMGTPDYAFRCLKTEQKLASETSRFLKLYNGQSPRKRRLCQVTSIVLCSLFCLHMMIWWCRPWFGPTWSSPEWSGLAVLF